MGRMMFTRLPGEGFTLTTADGQEIRVVIESVRRGPSGRMEISVTAPPDVRIRRIDAKDSD